jgi:hypothetical protein
VAFENGLRLIPADRMTAASHAGRRGRREGDRRRRHDPLDDRYRSAAWPDAAG